MSSITTGTRLMENRELNEMAWEIYYHVEANRCGFSSTLKPINMLGDIVEYVIINPFDADFKIKFFGVDDLWLADETDIFYLHYQVKNYEEKGGGL